MNNVLLGIESNSSADSYKTDENKVNNKTLDKHVESNINKTLSKSLGADKNVTIPS